MSDATLAVQYSAQVEYIYELASVLDIPSEALFVEVRPQEATTANSLTDDPEPVNDNGTLLGIN